MHTQARYLVHSICARRSSACTYIVCDQALRYLCLQSARAIADQVKYLCLHSACANADQAKYLRPCAAHAPGKVKYARRARVAWHGPRARCALCAPRSLLAPLRGALPRTPRAAALLCWARHISARRCDTTPHLMLVHLLTTHTPWDALPLS